MLENYSSNDDENCDKIFIKYLVNSLIPKVFLGNRKSNQNT